MGTPDRSPTTQEAGPGLGGVIGTSGYETGAVLGYLGAMPAAYDIIDAVS